MEKYETRRLDMNKGGLDLGRTIRTLAPFIMLMALGIKIYVIYETNVFYETAMEETRELQVKQIIKHSDFTIEERLSKMKNLKLIVDRNISSSSSFDNFCRFITTVKNNNPEVWQARLTDSNKEYFLYMKPSSGWDSLEFSKIRYINQTYSEKEARLYSILNNTHVSENFIASSSSLSFNRTKETWIQISNSTEGKSDGVIDGPYFLKNGTNVIPLLRISFSLNINGNLLFWKIDVDSSFYNKLAASFKPGTTGAFFLIKRNGHILGINPPSKQYMNMSGMIMPMSVFHVNHMLMYMMGKLGGVQETTMFVPHGGMFLFATPVARPDWLSIIYYHDVDFHQESKDINEGAKTFTILAIVLISLQLLISFTDCYMIKTDKRIVYNNTGRKKSITLEASTEYLVQSLRQSQKSPSTKLRNIQVKNQNEAMKESLKNTESSSRPSTPVTLPGMTDYN